MGPHNDMVMIEKPKKSGKEKDVESFLATKTQSKFVVTETEKSKTLSSKDSENKSLFMKKKQRNMSMNKWIFLKTFKPRLVLRLLPK